jgi:S1-C subfamily serine protease
MDDIQLQEAIERYLTDDMSVQEATQFESIRKSTPEIDQMVVEHEMFIRQMDHYAGRKNFSIQSEQIFARLYNQGYWTLEEDQTTMYKVIQLWDKYKKVTAIAASVGGFIALFTSALIVYLSPSLNGNQLLQLSKAVEVIKKNQQVQGHILNEVKTKIPENAKLVSGGSGFLIDTKGFIITNAHVLKGNSAIVINSNGEELNANIVYADKTTDLALLQITDKEFKQPKQLPFSIRNKMTELGEEIFTLGYPRNDNDIVYGKGYLSAQSGYDGDSNSYQIQISANPGYSGAPVFNDKSELVGIISTRQKQAEGVAFAIKSNKIYDLVNELKENENTHDISIKLAKNNASSHTDRKNNIKNLKHYIYSIKSFN